jgi:hypothetical protein
MSMTAQDDEVARPLARIGAVRFVFWCSVLYVVIALGQAAYVVVQMITRLAARSTGITLTFNPEIPVPQPTSFYISGAPHFVRGSTAVITQMSGTVVGVPASSIVLTSLGDLMLTVAAAGIGVCLAVVSQRIRAGAPFAHASSNALITLAVIVLVGFEGADILHALGALFLESVSVASPQPPDGRWSLSTSGSQITFFELWPVYVSTALVALAAAFRAGADYQRNSEGLV